MKPNTNPIRRSRYMMGGAPIGLNNLVEQATKHNLQHPKPLSEPSHPRIAFASDAMKVLGSRLVQHSYV